ncbi:MAG: acyltransferase [Clostridiales bacterium]|nr:acyltransferase [Clostridiales bacterium]
MHRERIRFLSAARIIALLLVLFYHLFPDFLRGAFIGVELFFALSGFLLAHACIAEVSEQGRFSLFAFLKRRVKRVYPELFFSVLLTLPFLLLVSSDFRVGLPRQLAAVFTFSTNIFELQTGGAYEAALLPHAHVHTWFLSVELQLCAGFGLLCALFGGGRKSKARPHFAQLLGVAALILAVASYVFLQYIYAEGAEPTPYYFSPATHALPFFAGIALCTLGRPRVKKPGLPLAVAALCVAGLVYASAKLTYADAFTWHFGLLLACILSCALIAALWTLHSAAPEQIREPKWIQSAAALAYPLYLTHWPLWVVFSALYFLRAWMAALITLAVSVALCLLMRYVFTRKDRIWRAFTVSLCAACLIAVGMLCADIPPLLSITKDIRASYIEEDVLLLREAQDRIFRHSGPFALRSDGVDVYSMGAREALAAPGPAPTPAPTPEPFVAANLDVVIVGDSVTLGARAALRTAFPKLQLDADVSRGWGAAKRILQNLNKQGKLPEYIVIALGTNPTRDEKEKAEDILAWIPAGSRVILVTPFDGRAARFTRTHKTAEMLRELATVYDYISIADWESVAMENKRGLSSDTVHLSSDEVRLLYVQCIIEAAEEAFRKAGKT